VTKPHWHVLTGLLLGLGTAAALLLSTHTTPPVAPPEKAGAMTSTTVRLPSPEGTGLPTGTLAVRVCSPISGAARYPHGAPVVVFVPGGTEAGTLVEPLSLATDTVRIVSLLPGGCDGPICSDGVYDYRGAHSIAALRDVVLYAAGVLTDVSGHSIDDVVDVPVLHDNVGLFGASNGGNIVAATAARHGDDLFGHLRYLVQWESPVSSQMATVELGPVTLCPTQTLQAVNPRYQTYGSLSLTLDYSQLTYNPTDLDHPLFWDGTGDGKYTLTDTVDGCRTPDLDGDDVLSTDEDFPLTPFIYGHVDVYSRQATQALADQSVFSPTWPVTIANPAQADAFWDLREAVHLYPTATHKIPDLQAMILSSVEDHVQIAPERPHIHQAFDGWQDTGAWVQINPSPAYVTEISPSLAGNPNLPDNAPNTAPVDYSADDYVYPNGLGEVYWAAAVHHMADRVPVYVELPSASTGSPTGTLAVRVDAPSPGQARYEDGAPVIIWVHGGYTPGRLRNDLPDTGNDVILINFLFPGGAAPAAGMHSDGVYDERGVTSTLALRDVVLYAAGVLTDSQGRLIDEVVPVDVLHENIGLIGISNGGNIPVTLTALNPERPYRGLHSAEITPYLQYIIQWETPVSSQIANRDLGRVVLDWDSGKQGEYVNPRYQAYGPLTLTVDYSDLACDPTGEVYPIFHDGNGDALYTTVTDTTAYPGLPSPDLNDDGVLSTTEDFPLGSYPSGDQQVYSRPATHAFEEYNVFSTTWPITIATPAEADAYWDLREAVRLYISATQQIPHLRGVVLANVEDHVQSAPDKPHIRQAFEGWQDAGAWVRLNPDPTYLIEADPTLIGDPNLPNNSPNTAPEDWTAVNDYCVPRYVEDSVYQLAAIWEMADRTHDDCWYRVHLPLVLWLSQ